MGRPGNRLGICAKIGSYPDAPELTPSVEKPDERNNLEAALERHQSMHQVSIAGCRRIGTILLAASMRGKAGRNYCSVTDVAVSGWAPRDSFQPPIIASKFLTRAFKLGHLLLR